MKRSLPHTPPAPSPGPGKPLYLSGEPGGEPPGLLRVAALAVNADDRFGIRTPHIHPLYASFMPESIFATSIPGRSVILSFAM